MRVAFLCKRRYMSKDVVADRYGRLYELPLQLARRGHEVRAFCLDYRGSGTSVETHDVAPGLLEWHSRGAGPLILPGLVAHYRGTRAALEAFRPDIVVAASDSLHVAFGARLAATVDRPFVADLYDNFESFGLTRVPGLRAAFRRALADADAVACVSTPLLGHVRATCAPRGELMVLESTIAAGTFQPRPRVEARARLGLDGDARYVGYAGALDDSRGIEAVYRAFDAVARSRPGTILLLAGPVGTPALPLRDDVRHLGLLAHAQVEDFYAALDVGLLCMKDSAFGRNSFPQKAYEMLSMRIPVVFADVGAMGALLASWPRNRYRAGDAADLQARIEGLLDEPVVPDVPVPTWETQAGRLEAVLQRAVDAARRSA